MFAALREITALVALAGSSQVYAVLVYHPYGTGSLYRLAFVTSGRTTTNVLGASQLTTVS